MTNLENLVIKSIDGVYNVCLEDVYYFESDLRKINIYLKTDKICYYDTLSRLQSNLDDRFYKCHRSFIVNMDKIFRIYENYIYFKDIDQIVPISRSRKNELLNHLEQKNDKKREYKHFWQALDYKVP